jgi:hypothetical protein
MHYIKENLMSIAYKTGLATSAVVRLFTKATTKVVTDFGRGMAQGTMKSQPLPVDIDEQIMQELSPEPVQQELPGMNVEQPKGA